MTTRLKTKATSSPPTLERLARQVDAALERLLPPASRPPSPIHEAMRYAVFSGGKRFRPLLCLGACEAGGQPARRALHAACAIELMHTYSLVHDDLPAMDNAELRRGQPTCHRRFGEAQAILVGDALLTLAFQTVSQDKTPKALAIIRVLGEAGGTEGLIGGQVLDLEAMRGRERLSAEAWRDIARRKTAALIQASVQSGALAAGAGTGERRALARYGRDLGLAFQLLDDVHDGEGLAEVLGVPAARNEAHWLIARAVKALAPFGARADALRHLAAWLEQT